MTDPTPEQIEAEALERFPELAPTYASLTYPAEAMRSHNRAAFKSGARWAALVASAGAAPPEPAEDRVMMIAEHLAQAHTFTRADGEAIARAALKLAAPVRVDEAKLVAFLESETHAPQRTHSPVDGSCQECPWQVVMLPTADLARELAAWVRGGGR